MTIVVFNILFKKTLVRSLRPHLADRIGWGGATFGLVQPNPVALGQWLLDPTTQGPGRPHLPPIGLCTAGLPSTTAHLDRP